MSASQPIGIILAAGKGTRMKSDLPKALHRIVGLPMVEHIARAMTKAGIERIIVVIGHRGEEVQAELGDRYEYAWQREQLGTGHATLTARSLLTGHSGPVIVAPGDAPLLDENVFNTLLSEHGDAVCTIASSVIDNPTGYGRIVRDAAGAPCRIVEERDARPEQKQIREVNASLYCFDGAALFKQLPLLKNTNSQGEYYLTDLVEIFYRQGSKVKAVIFDDPAILAGVNDRWQLSQAENELRLRILKRHALSGVTIRDPAMTFVGPDVEIGIDCTIDAGTQLVGSTKLGPRCSVGPYSRIENCEVGPDSVIWFSHASGAKIGSGVKCGPYANLRPGTVLENGVKIGNFVEVKNTWMGEGVSAAHLSYLGDADIGDRTNVGAGTITCNYDGFIKSRTRIGKDVFVGSHATLIAPVDIGDSALIAAGSTITADVPTEAGAFGRARQETKEGWAVHWRKKRASQL